MTSSRAWACLALLACGCATLSGPATPTLGQPAPALVLQQLDGATFDLAAARGEVVVVNFWATWCSACRAEMPALDAFYAAHRAEGLKLIGVSVDRRRARDSVQQVAQTLHYPIGMLGEADVNGFGEPSVLPMTYVIDRQGRVAAVLTPGQSEVEERTLSAAVLPLLARTR